MLKCILVDDEPLAIQLLSAYAQKAPDLELVASFTNPIEALLCIQSQSIDLVFLDIQMPELTGIQLMKIAQQKSQFVLTTAYENYALESYDFDVVDYLLKPISFDRFLIAVEKAKQRQAAPEVPQTTPPNLVPSNTYIFVKTGFKTQKIDFDSIRFLEGLGDYIAIHTSEGKILTLEKMKYFEKVLPKSQFIRIHKSHIVSMDKIDFIEKNRVVIEGKYLPISATYANAFWEKIKK